MESLAIRLSSLFVLIAIANLMLVELVIVNGFIFASVGIAFAAFVKERGREHRYRVAKAAVTPDVAREPARRPIRAAVASALAPVFAPR